MNQVRAESSEVCPRKFLSQPSPSSQQPAPSQCQNRTRTLEVVQSSELLLNQHLLQFKHDLASLLPWTATYYMASKNIKTFTSAAPAMGFFRPDLSGFSFIHHDKDMENSRYYMYCTLEEKNWNLFIIFFVAFFKNQHVMSIMHLLGEGILQLLSPFIFSQL